MYPRLASFLLPASLALAALLTLGCRSAVEGTWPNGKPKAIRTYSFMSIFGAKDSAHLSREQTFYYNEKPEKDARYRKGVLHGTYRDFWHNGQKRSEGEYVDGKKQGEWKYSFNEFSVASKGAYKDDLKEGQWNDFFENGNLRAQGEYRAGREVGTWKRWDKKGELLEENACFEANEEGRYKSFHGGKTPKEDYNCRKGVPEGAYVKWSPEGEVEERGAFDTAGRKDGLWEKFHPGKAPAELRSYRSGLESDSLKAWDAKGRLIEKGFFVAGLGEVLSYDSLGRLKEKSQRAKGTPDGETWTYHPDGKPKSLVVYKEGKAVLYKRWHANGKLAGEGAFVDGKRSGEWTQFGDRGQPMEAALYKDGQLHGDRKLYDSTGKLMQVQRYEHGYPAEGKFPGGLKEKYGDRNGDKDGGKNGGKRTADGAGAPAGK